MTLISTELSDGIAVVRFDDGKANALNQTSLTALNAALDEAQTARAIVLTGRPGVFSAGLDLKTLPTMNAADLQAVLQLFGDTMLRLFTLRQPVVAACT